MKLLQWEKIVVRKVWLWFVLACVSMVSDKAVGEEAPTAYRKILVPADSPATWSRDGEQFLPVESSEFEHLIATANAPAGEALLVDAEYEARIDGHRLVGGRGKWRISLRGDRPAQLSLKDTSLVLSDAMWRGKTQRPAHVGWWPATQSRGMTYRLEIPHSGELDFHWHSPQATRATGTLEFPLRMPTSTRTRLILHLPAGKRPQFEGGIILESPQEASAGGRWVLGVAESPTAVLRIEDASSTSAAKLPFVSLREDLRYILTPRGVELVATLQFERSDNHPKELSLAIPKGMQLVAASAGEQKLAWRVASGNEKGVAVRTLVELPNATASGAESIQLRAWSPLLIDQRQPLPQLIVSEVICSIDTIEVVLDESLVLHELNPIDCVQTAVHAEPSPHGTRKTLRFAAYSPQAVVELSVGLRAASGRVRLVTALEVGNPNIEGRLKATVSVDSGSLLALSVKLQPGWSIDAVEAVPADALAEWYLEREDGGGTLALQFARAITPERPLAIHVSGHWQRSAPLERLKLASLCFLQWHGLAVEQDLLYLKAAEPYELAPIGELQSLSREAVADVAGPIAIATASSVGKWFDAKTAGANAAVQLASKQGTYDAEIEIEVALAGGLLQQIQHVECRPRGSGIDHVLVYLSEPSAVPPRWLDTQSGEPLIAERMPATDPRLGGLPRGGELWLVSFRRLYARPIRFMASFTTPWPTRRRVPLVSLPDATTQQARVGISSRGVARPAITTRGMTPTPLPLPSGATNGMRASFRFPPTRFYDIAAPPRLWVGPPLPSDGAGELVASDVQIESHYATDGSGMHRITYQLENRGAEHVEMAIPANMQLAATHVEGVMATEVTTNVAAEKVAIRLPADRSSVELILELRSREQRLGNGRRLQSPLPASEILVLRGRWSRWLPHGFQVVSDSFDWRQRLFGPLARQQNVPRFNPLKSDDWNELLLSLNFSGTRSAAAAEDLLNASLEMPSGWHAFEVGFVGAPPEPFTVAHQQATAAWALAVFLGSVFIAWLAGVRLLSTLLLAMAAALITILLPIHYSPLATAAMLGFSLVTLWKGALHLTTVRQARIVLAAIIFLISSSDVRAEEEATTIHRVLTPVDANGVPTGTKVFVSDRFFRQLLKANDKRSANYAWLLIGMRCRGEFLKRPNSPQFDAGLWALSFEIEVRTRDATIELPLVKNNATWADTASLDGIPTEILWDDFGQSCSVQINEPGRYVLSFSFEPHVEESAGRRNIDLDLLPVAGATLRLVSPSSLVDLRVADTELSQRDEPTHTVRQGVLDGSGQLRVSWSEDLAGTFAHDSRRVDELLWLQVEPEGVSLDAKYVLQSDADWPDTIDVLIDHRWELKSDANPLVQKVLQHPDGRQRIRVAAPTAAKVGHEIWLRFRSRAASPLGRWQVPTIELTAIPVENRWLAVTCAASLECHTSTTTPAAAEVIGNFPAAWGTIPETSLPQFVLNAAQLDTAWRLIVRPRQLLSLSRDRLSLAVGKQRLRLLYQADITGHGVDRFGWSLTVPAELTVESLVVEVAGEPWALDWVRVAPNRINLFFTEEVTQPYHLQLVGSLPGIDAGRLPIPRLAPANQPATTQTVALYHEPDMLAVWKFPGDTPWAESGASELFPFGAAARFAQAYAIDPTTVNEVSIAVEPNAPSVTGQTLTTLTESGGSWVATLHCQLHVDRGEVDKLLFQVPTTWGGPFEVTVPATSEMSAPLIAGRPTTLTVSLLQPILAGETLQLTLRSPLVMPDRQLVSAPHIVPQTAGTWRNYLSLPKLFQGKEAAWTLRGVEPASPPAELLLAMPDAAGVETYRIASDTIGVTLRPRVNRVGDANIRLAETKVQISSAGGMLSTTRFIIVPQSLSQCVVELPPHVQLVGATLDGHTVFARQLESNRWQIQLGTPNLPQTLEIVSRLVLKTDTPLRRVELSRPVLEQSRQRLPVELSLWSLQCDSAVNTPRVVNGAIMPPADQASLRLERLVSISQAATAAVLELPSIDGQRWFVTWSSLLKVAARDARALQRPTASGPVATRVTQPSDDPLTVSTARATAWIGQMAELFANAEPVASRDDLPTESSDNSIAPDNCLFGQLYAFISAGNQDHLRIDFVPTGITDRLARLLALAALAALAVTAVWLFNKPAACDLAANWPEAIALVMGIGGWAWLRFSALGLALATVSGVLLVHRIYQHRKSPRHGGTNQPNSIPEELA